MKFEVINQLGAVVMWCEDYSCIPNPDSLKSMAEFRYTFRLDGKAISCSKLIEKLKAGEPSKPEVKSETHTTNGKIHRWF